MTNIKRLMKDFCQSTTLHGYSYLNNADSIIAKVLWGVMITAATGLGIAFLVSNTNAYMKATIVTNIFQRYGDIIHIFSPMTDLEDILYLKKFPLKKRFQICFCFSLSIVSSACMRIRTEQNIRSDIGMSFYIIP